MHPVAVPQRVEFDVRYEEQRDRVTTGFRLILAIPHFIFSGVWGYAAELAGVIQWFIVLFTGKRNRGIWEFQDRWLSYAARVNAYASLLYDPYPDFGDDQGKTPTRYSFVGEEPADRLTNGLRIIWAIPALIIGFGLMIAGFAVAVASWFVIVFTGRHPDGMFRFILGVQRYNLQLQSYVLLMTDAYPNYGIASGSTPAIASGPPAGSSGSAPPPPPQY